MPRIARKNSQSNYYHIIVQGINREYIFNEKKDIEKYKEIIKSKLEKSNIQILAYCIMNNHAHFLIYSEKVEYLSKFMQKVNTTYSQYYNKTNRRVGYVFRDRYYSQDILNENQLFQCIKYIHNNPIKAKICNKLKEYKHSSYNEFYGEKEIISKEGIKLIYETINNNIETKSSMIDARDDNTYTFIDIKDKDIDMLLIEFEKKYKKNIDEIKRDKNILGELIKAARRETNITLVEMANILQLSKSTIFRYSKNE